MDEKVNVLIEALAPQAGWRIRMTWGRDLAEANTGAPNRLRRILSTSVLHEDEVRDACKHVKHDDGTGPTTRDLAEALTGVLQMPDTRNLSPTTILAVFCVAFHMIVDPARPETMTHWGKLSTGVIMDDEPDQAEGEQQDAAAPRPETSRIVFCRRRAALVADPPEQGPAEAHAAAPQAAQDIPAPAAAPAQAQWPPQGLAHMPMQMPGQTMTMYPPHPQQPMQLPMAPEGQEWWLPFEWPPKSITCAREHIRNDPGGLMRDVSRWMGPKISEVQAAQHKILTALICGLNKLDTEGQDWTANKHLVQAADLLIREQRYTRAFSQDKSLTRSAITPHMKAAADDDFDAAVAKAELELQKSQQKHTPARTAGRGSYQQSPWQSYNYGYQQPYSYGYGYGYNQGYGKQQGKKGAKGKGAKKGAKGSY